MTIIIRQSNTSNCSPSQETLFHNRTILDEDDADNETLAGMAAAADVGEEKNEIPAFLVVEKMEEFD